MGYSVVEVFESEFPNRFANVGVSEQAGMGIAAGLAKSHLSIFYSIANFPSFRCLEQIRNDVAHKRNPVMIVSLRAGFSYGTAGSSHHAIKDAAAVGAIFGMSVFTPACVHELDSVLESYWDSPSPIYVRLGSSEVCQVCLPSVSSELSPTLQSMHSSEISTVFVTHGEIGYLVAKGLEQTSMGYQILSVADFNLSSNANLEAIARYRNVVTVEEYSREFGFGARLRAKLCNWKFDNFEIMGVPNLDFHVGRKREFHLQGSGFTESDFVRTLETFH